MKGIKLTQGQFAIVDEEDYYYLNEFKWYFYRRRNQVYAKTCVTINKKRVHLLMHRLIMDASKKCVDHINGNGLDNRKSNLRLCERHENALNRVINYNNVSGLSNEGKEKLIKHQPETIGQASRILGVSPSDVSVLMIHLGR
jgi:tRNA U34 5-carboxymethylaminomethyl modifying enzyme MnmG/GidA